MTAPHLDRLDWRDTAACRGANPAIFVPPKPRHNGSPILDWHLNMAREMCDTCPHTGINGPCVAEGVADAIALGRENRVGVIRGGIYLSHRLVGRLRDRQATA